MSEYRFDTLLFDLDGTIVDSAPGVTRAFAYALKKYGIDADPDDLKKVVGPPLSQSFVDFYGFSREKATEAVEKYREYYRDRGIFECELYYGISDLLFDLKKRGLKLLVASSKPTVFVEKIAVHFGIDGCFSHIVGAELDGRRTDKSEVVAEAIALSGSGRERILMVGDRSFDIVGGHNMGVKVAAVGWGYGNAEELAEADYIVNAPEEIIGLIGGTPDAGTKRERI